MRTILTTVGASLLSNAARELNKKLSELTDEDLANYLRTTDPEKASAETNSLCRLLRNDDLIVFLHSQTQEGERCARLLKNHYESRGYRAEVQAIPDLTYKESRFKMRGLRSLVSKMVELIERERNRRREVIINATGGFKAEIAYATLVGLLFDVPVYYIHEKFQDIVDMPPVPVSWDYSLFVDYESFFEWIDGDLRPADEVNKRLKGLPREVQFLLTEEDGYVMLSPAGEAFYQAFKRERAARETVPILLSRKALDAYSRMDVQNRRRVDDYLGKLRFPVWRAKNSEQPHGCDCFVAPRGHIDLRIFYYEADDGSLRVLEILDHDEYLRLLKRGVSRGAYEEFHPWNG